MSWAKITLFGFEQYMEMSGKSLFDGLILPEGINKDVLTENIFINAGEFEVLYSDPNFLQIAIGNWGRKWYRTFDKWVTALNIEYDPLYNYDRHEEWTDNRIFNGSIAKMGGETNTNDLQIASNTSMTTEETRSAFDSSTYQPLNKTEVTGDSDDNVTTNTGTVKREAEETEGTHNKDDLIHKGHLYGNIGVVSSQQMLESELKISEWNIYEHITDMFIREFLIPIYE